MQPNRTTAAAHPAGAAAEHEQKPGAHGELSSTFRALTCVQVLSLKATIREMEAQVRRAKQEQLAAEAL
jgi:hypothetical protein